MIFMTDEEVRELTGYAYSARQIEWLKANRWLFEVTGQGRPKVARSYFDARMTGLATVIAADGGSEARPNFAAIGQVLAKKYGKTSSEKSQFASTNA
jgi:hypothetical protein